MSKCVYNTIFASNTLSMALKSICCCSHVISIQVMVDEKLPQQIYNILEKSYETFYYIVFLEVFQFYEIIPIGFYIKKTACVGKPSKNFLLLCEKELAAAQFKLTELTVIELFEKLFDLETDFVSKFNLSTVQEDWLLKTRHRLEKYERKLLLKKLKKIRKFARNKDSCFAWLERFESHYQYFCLKQVF